jgi:hypothetical protein
MMFSCLHKIEARAFGGAHSGNKPAFIFVHYNAIKAQGQEQK